MKLNIEKSNVIHFRPKRHIKSEYRFTYGNDTLTIIDKYKYLGVILDEFLNFESCVQVLSEAAGRALGPVIHKFKTLKEIGFRTFERMYMYEAGVASVNDYAAEIWGFKNYNISNNVQNRAMRYYLGVHKFAQIVDMQGDFGGSGTDSML